MPTQMARKTSDVPKSGWSMTSAIGSAMCARVFSSSGNSPNPRTETRDVARKRQNDADFGKLRRLQFEVHAGNRQFNPPRRAFRRVTGEANH